MLPRLQAKRSGRCGVWCDKCANAGRHSETLQRAAVWTAPAFWLMVLRQLLPRPARRCGVERSSIEQQVTQEPVQGFRAVKSCGCSAFMRPGCGVHLTCASFPRDNIIYFPQRGWLQCSGAHAVRALRKDFNPDNFRLGIRRLRNAPVIVGDT